MEYVCVIEAGSRIVANGTGCELDSDVAREFHLVRAGLTLVRIYHWKIRSKMKLKTKSCQTTVIAMRS
jgi:hypothetical protein